MSFLTSIYQLLLLNIVDQNEIISQCQSHISYEHFLSDCYL